MKRWLIALLLPAGLVPLPGQTGAAGGRDSAGIRIMESAAPVWTKKSAWHLDQSPAITIGSANGESAFQFGNVVGAVRLSDGSIVVADAKSAELRHFSAAGKFLRKIGQRGEGPGDFAALASIMRVAGDTVVTWDYRVHRLTWFTPDAKATRTLAIDRPARISTPDGHTMGSSLAVIGMLSDGTVLANFQDGRFNPKPGLYSDSQHVVHGGGTGKIVPIATLFKGESYSFEASGGYVLFGDRPFTTKASFATGANSLVYTDGLRPEVREYDLGGRLIRIIRLRRPAQSVTGADIAAFREHDLAETRSEKFRKESDRQPAIDREKAMLAWIPFPKVMPAFTALKLDPAGDIWVREYGDSTKAEQWELFEKSGRWLGTLVMPAGIDLFEVGLDYVLGRVKDEDDVESVQLYRVLH